MKKEKEERDREKRSGLWGLVLWNMLVTGGLLFFFAKQLPRISGAKSAGPEALAFLVVIPLVLIVNAKPAFRNIKKLYLSYQEEPLAVGRREEPEAVRGAFMEMYRKLSRRRIFLILALPLIYVAALTALTPVISRGAFSWESMLRLLVDSPLVFYSFVPCILICLGISLKIYVSKERNLDRLSQIYDRAAGREMEDLDRVGEKQAGYVFTDEFLINWDSCLNIIPLKEIRKIKYVRYFYLILSGTKLKITCGRKKYVLWHSAPSEAEWIRRGFITPDGKPEKRVSMNMNLPM